MPYNPVFPPEYYRNSQNVLEIALNRLGAYKSWRVNDPGQEYSIDERYAVMPSLTKADIRRHFPAGFVPAELDINRGLSTSEISFVTSSGSTDAKVTNIWNQKFWDASEQASWQLNAHTRGVATGDHREAILVNPLNVGIISDETELPMDKRRLARFLYLNEKTDPLSWSEKYMNRMVKEMAVFRPTILEANPTLLAKLSRHITIQNKSVFQPEIIVLTYEFPSSLYLKQIRRVFNAPVISSFGTTETGYVFMQCEAGKFHQNANFCRVDFQPLTPKHGGPFLGRLLVTTFNNPWYYIVRFDVGDLARIDAKGECTCGRNSGWILSAIEGRASNVTMTNTGRLVSLRELDDSLCVLEGIDEYTLEQTARDDYHLHLVSQRRDKQDLTKAASTILKNLYGQNSEISVIFQDAIAPESSGKYSLAKASFPIDINSFLAQDKLLKSNAK